MFFPATPLLRLRRGRHRFPWPGDAMLFARARFALHEGLRCLAIERRLTRVWLPAYLCCPVQHVIRALGLEPMLYDVDERLAPRLVTIAPRAGDALLIVHYFGLVHPMSGVRRFAREHGMPLVEDAAHALPAGSARGAGSVGDVSVWSLRKLGAVPGGGLLAIPDPAVRRHARTVTPAMATDRRTLARLGVMVTERLAFTVGANVLRLKDRLPVLDASERVRACPPLLEYTHPPLPSRLVAAMLAWVDWESAARARRVAYRVLAERLRDTADLVVPVPEASRESVPESFPVLVSDPQRLVRVLRKRGVEAMQWPGAEQFPFDAVRFPGSAEWVADNLCLPLSPALSARGVERLADVVLETVGSRRERRAAA
jgi:dTDP-4-amino-4,6-dideoxygalactose transaminase